MPVNMNIFKDTLRIPIFLRILRLRTFLKLIEGSIHLVGGVGGI